MKMYVWESTALEGYAKGSIVVLAESVEQARKMAYEEFYRWAKEHKDWRFNRYGKIDEMFTEDVISFRRKFESDIAVIPETKTVLFMKGSYIPDLEEPPEPSLDDLFGAKKISESTSIKSSTPSKLRQTL